MLTEELVVVVVLTVGLGVVVSVLTEELGVVGVHAVVVVLVDELGLPVSWLLGCSDPCVGSWAGALS